MNDFHMTARKLWKPKNNTLKSLLIKRVFWMTIFPQWRFYPELCSTSQPKSNSRLENPFTIFWSIPTDGMQANQHTLGKTSLITCVLFSHVKLPRNANDVFLKLIYFSARRRVRNLPACLSALRQALLNTSEKSSVITSDSYNRLALCRIRWTMSCCRWTPLPRFSRQSPSFVSRKSQEATHLMWESESWRRATSSAPYSNESLPSTGTPGSLKASV